jgi:hypothetical protein
VVAPKGMVFESGPEHLNKKLKLNRSPKAVKRRVMVLRIEKTLNEFCIIRFIF